MNPLVPSKKELMQSRGSQGSVIGELRKYSVVDPNDAFPGSNSDMMGGFGLLIGIILLGISYFTILVTFPLSLVFCIKVVAEYERAVIFRLGRILPPGARGPGLFFIVPCMDNIRRVDLRTVTFDVPPQEVSLLPLV
ncbi:Stomatin [Cichlidogyrus casuarinus]|uniref:Stomatin n=1 Tax=Cichlidogyrus casuarinus TaxID=1844966 RepID=A0ABD2QCN0_9PLAT